MEQENRVVVLIDMDCFYCQVEEKLNPELKGQPIAVVQYNPWKGGGIIAVNYVARARGVTRHMRGDEAKEKCPEIQLPSVPCNRGKANISKYRDAGIEVAKVLQTFTPLLERASIDEAYLDITAPIKERLKTLNISTINSDMMPNTFALGYDSIEQFISDVHNYGCDSIDFDHDHARMLLAGAVLVSEIRAAVFRETGYTCSAGIAHNKILAKLVCGMNKPNKQSVLPKHTVNILYKTLPVKKVKHLGGKFGLSVCGTLQINNMYELQKFSEKELQAKFDEKNGTWLYNIARGIDLEPVQAKFNPKSIGCCKNFKGKSAILDLENLTKWLKDLGDEIEDRLEKDAVDNNRAPRQMVASFSTLLPDGRGTSSSRSYNFVNEEELCAEFFSNKALELVMESVEGVKVKEGEANRKLKASITFLGISVGKFEDHSEKKTKKIMDFFTAGSSKDATTTNKSKETGPNESKAKDKRKNDKENMMRRFFKINENEEKSEKKLEETNIVPKESDESNPELPKDRRTVETKADDTQQKSDKDYIMQRFLNDKSDSKLKEPIIHRAEDSILNKRADIIDIKPPEQSSSGLESNLDKQESFFAKFLLKSDAVRPATPVCNVIPCGEDSNDTNCSGSTIELEINRSIALFDDDPEKTNRVSSMRELLNTTAIAVTELEEQGSDIELEGSPNLIHPEPIPSTATHLRHSPNELETFQCSECMKQVPVNMFDTHADYHLALKLRDEERQQVRNERLKPIPKTVVNSDSSAKKKQVEVKNESVCSIASFLVKVDNNVPTEKCGECGKRVPVEKLTEHLDFHEARKLSRQLNAKPSPVVPTNIKRKRSSGSPVKKTKMPCKSIQSFFGSNR
ncbi:DNA polymerase eta [Cydia strobilella]|uniref:DNA polymerase eta n=1 Tax=Cydia strobilella TaxID=1100964 RepID=UPI003004F07A